MFLSQVFELWVRTLVHRERVSLLTQRDKRTLTGTKSILGRLLEQKVF